MKVLCHEGSSTAKLNALHESVVCAHVQHPNVVSSAKAFVLHIPAALLPIILARNTLCQPACSRCQTRLTLGLGAKLCVHWRCRTWLNACTADCANQLHAIFGALADVHHRSTKECCVLQIVTYKIHTVLKDTSLAADANEDDDEAFIRSLKIKTLCELPQRDPRRVSR